MNDLEKLRLRLQWLEDLWETCGGSSAGTVPPLHEKITNLRREIKELEQNDNCNNNT